MTVAAQLNQLQCFLSWRLKLILVFAPLQLQTKEGLTNYSGGPLRVQLT